MVIIREDRYVDFLEIDIADTIRNPNGRAKNIWSN